ncbi:hypothetical protein [Amycolatopsis sp. cmx-4-68]
MLTSPAAMSRTLSRLRRTLGDPLLVRAVSFPRLSGHLT